MTHAKHSPWPFVLRSDRVIGDAQGRRIATLHDFAPAPTGYQRLPQSANAALMLAAPQMLDYLVRLVELVEGGEGLAIDRGAHLHLSARSLVALAIGRESDEEAA